MTDVAKTQPNVFQKSANDLTKEKLVGKKEAFGPIFDKFDVNKDGTLDKAEARATKGFMQSLFDRNIPMEKALKAEGFNLNKVFAFGYNFESEIFVDGKIDRNFQRNEGDCWVLFAVNALANTTKGAECIKESIKEKENGNIAVTLKGAKKTFEFTPEEIKAAKKRLSAGDDDVVLVEMAIETHRKELLESKTGTMDVDSVENNIGLGTKKHPLKGGLVNEAFFLLTGKQSLVYTSPDGQTAPDKSIYIDASGVEKNLDIMMNNPDKYASGAIFKDTKKGNLVNNHFYSIKRVEKDSIVLVNPWDSGEEFAMPRKEFMTKVDEMAFCDMEK